MGLSHALFELKAAYCALGSVTVNVVPTPTSELTVTEPPLLSAT